MELERIKQILNQNRKVKYTEKELKQLISLVNTLKDICISNLLKSSRV